MLLNAEARTEIERRLKRVESEFGVHIIYACESGSRGWGFPSVNSDYDVRFLYVHPKDWYLSVSSKRDVIEIPIVDDYDVGGWDIKKTLSLLYNSNPALMEWLSCPIVYSSDAVAMKPMFDLVDDAFSPLGAYHHYRSMAKQHLSKMKTDKKVRIKHYLYTLRPLMACRWLLTHGSQPPMLYSELMSDCLEDGSLKDEIEKLVKIKSGYDEIKEVDHIQVIDEFIEEEYRRITDEVLPEPRKASIDKFDAVLREVIELCADRF